MYSEPLCATNAAFGGAGSHMCLKVISGDNLGNDVLSLRQFHIVSVLFTCFKIIN